MRKKLRRRQRLFARGERGDALVVVLQGRLHVARGDAVLRSLAAGAVVGLSTVVTAPLRAATRQRRPPSHTADVVAADASEVLLVPGRFVRALFAKRPELPLVMIASLAQLVSDLSDDVEALRNDDIEARAKKKLAQLLRGRREVAVTHGDLARMIGATRANTSRALARLEARGVLRRRRGRIEAP